MVWLTEKPNLSLLALPSFSALMSVFLPTPLGPTITSALGMPPESCWCWNELRMVMGVEVGAEAGVAAS